MTTISRWILGAVAGIVLITIALTMMFRTTSAPSASPQPTKPLEAVVSADGSVKPSPSPRPPRAAETLTGERDERFLETLPGWQEGLDHQTAALLSLRLQRKAIEEGKKIADLFYCQGCPETPGRTLTIQVREVQREEFSHRVRQPAPISPCAGHLMRSICEEEQRKFH